MKPQLPLSSKERGHLFKLTAAMPRKIEKLLHGLRFEQLINKPASGFSLHEHVWHLADLEKDAFAQRIRSVLSEDKSTLKDFPGDKIAIERDYHHLPLQKAFKQFSETRLNNLWILSGIHHSDWMLSAHQEGLGLVRLVDIFRNMVEHDIAHLDEMNALLDPNYHFSPSTTVAA